MSTREIDLTYCTLLPVNKEFEEIASKFEKSMGKSCCIQNIYKIEHEELVRRFEETRNHITTLRGIVPQEVMVFHGTTASGARGIVEKGFDKTYSRVAAYGLGTYASVDARTALSYCKDIHTNEGIGYIFLCRFLKGIYGHGSSGRPINTNQMDHSGTVGDSILVTPYDGAIMPVYLLEYYIFDNK